MVIAGGLLTHYGAIHPQLLIGLLGNHPITQLQFIENLSSISQLATHNSEIEHDDDLKESEFDDFPTHGNALIFNHDIFSRHIRRGPKKYHIPARKRPTRMTRLAGTGGGGLLRRR